MRYHNITYDDMLNGNGLRVVLWVAGCTHKCFKCHNQMTWDINDGILFDEKAKEEIYNYMKRDYIDGITLSGGDPLHPANVCDIRLFVKELKKHFPNKTIWLYTGFLWEDINVLDFIKYIDIVVDGKFKIELKNSKKHWAGSSNQRIIDVKESLLKGKTILWED